jgi:hypothetical protein
MTGDAPRSAPASADGNSADDTGADGNSAADTGADPTNVTQGRRDRARIVRPGRRTTRLRVIVIASILVLAVIIVLVIRAVSLSAAQQQLDAAALTFRSDQAAAVQTVTDGESALDAAIATLAASEGKVLSEQPRTDLAEAIAGATTRLSAAAQELTAAEAAAATASGTVSDTTSGTTAGSAAVSTTLFGFGDGARERARALSAVDFAATAGLDGIQADLAAPVAAVTQAMADWQAEQDRLLAGRYTNNVHAVGWNAELDQCIGSVDVTAHYEQVPTIAEHWSCGGKDFPDDAGTVITLTGVHAGTYRVDGIVAMLSAARHGTGDVPRGHDLLYQTCQNGQSSTMSFTALTRLPD